MSRALLLEAIRNRTTPRPAWVPYVGCHGGALIGKSARDYLCSADLLVQGLTTAVALYRPDGLPVMFDLQLEAELLGCRLHWSDDTPPCVVDHPLEQGSIAQLPHFEAGGGRMAEGLRALEILHTRFGDELAWYALVCGPFTLANHLRGNQLFLDMCDEPARVHELMAYCTEIACASAQAWMDAGADVVAIVDPMVSQISPSDFQQMVQAPLNRVLDFVRLRGRPVSLFVCGDVNPNLEGLAATHADNLSVDEQVPMTRLREVCQRAGKSFGGNLRLTATLLLGQPDDARREAIERMDAAGTTGFILAPGCDLPYATPPANLRAVAEMVHDPYARETARALLAQRAEDHYEDVQLPDYAAADGVVLDVITLDSTSCAPCQYMMEAVRRAAERSGVRCYINEHKIKVRQGLGVMYKLGVRNLPSVCIDGEVRFASLIPDPNQLVAAIREAAARRGLHRP